MLRSFLPLHSPTSAFHTLSLHDALPIFGSKSMQCGFESHPGHQSVVVQTSDVHGLICLVSASLLAGEGGGLDFGVEQGVERHSWIGVDGVVVGDRQSFEVGMVGDTTRGISE